MLDVLEGKIHECLNLPEDKMPEDILPTSTVFFFGSSDYDKWYFNQLRETLEFIEEHEST